MASLRIFFRAMLSYPHVQQKAYEELHTAVGKDRLPEFSDKSRLPYIQAVVKEVLRWLPVAPLGESVIAVYFFSYIIIRSIPPRRGC